MATIANWRAFRGQLIEPPYFEENGSVHIGKPGPQHDVTFNNFLLYVPKDLCVQYCYNCYFISFLKQA